MHVGLISHLSSAPYIQHSPSTDRLDRPIQTYKGRGTTKPRLNADDHGVIHTTPEAPRLLPTEQLTKYSIRVEPTKNEKLEPESRVNYGKAYAVEHNVKVLDIGMVVHNHRYLIEEYFKAAMNF